MADTFGWDEAGPDHIAHEQIANPFGILTVRLVPLTGLRIFGMGQCHIAGLFKDIEDRDPILTGRFHADIRTVERTKPVRQLRKAFGERREAGLFVDSQIVGIGDSDTGKDPGFMDIESTTVFTENLEHESLLKKEW